MDQPLSPELPRRVDAYWQAAYYLAFGQIYLYDNPFFREPLKPEHIKPWLLGHGVPRRDRSSSTSISTRSSTFGTIVVMRAIEREGAMAIHLPAGDSTSSAIRPAEAFTPARFDAILFGLDGVLTSTARVHTACCKQTFDDFLQARSTRTGEPFRPFDPDDDYKRFVDGKQRCDGVRRFLASRGITLPEGTPASPPDEKSVCGLGDRKDEPVKCAIRAGEAKTYPGSIAFVRWVRSLALKTAVMSSSHHCAEVLGATEIENLFDAQVDGEVVDLLHLPGKPAPDTYLHTAKLLGVTPPLTVVVEDATAEVQTGRAGGFGLVVGVDRSGSAEEPQQNGADLVVSDLGELVGGPDGGNGQ